MKSIVSVLAVMIMAFALVSTGEAAVLSCRNDNPGVSVETCNTLAGDGFKDADRAGDFSTGNPYPCIASPAYPDYVNARAIPCPVNEKARRVPEPMGSPGL